MPPWSYVYQYGVGGAVFAVSVVLLVRAGAIDPARREGRRALAILAAGFAGYAALHALTVFWLPAA